MKRYANRIGLLAVLLAAGAGCAMDVPRMMTRDEDLQSQVMAAIVADSALAARMTGQLLGSQPTRESLVEAVMADGDAARGVMMSVARDRTRLDAVLGLAVQDSATKEHVVTLLKGMQMAGTR